MTTRLFLAPFLTVLLCLLLLPTTSVSYTKDQEDSPNVMATTPATPAGHLQSENIFDKITRFAKHFKIPPKEMIALIRCETQNTFDTFVQSRAIQPYGRERSFGLAQLHLPAHPEITYKQATDPDYALIWIAQHWDKRHREWKTCMKNLDKYL